MIKLNGDEVRFVLEALDLPPEFRPRLSEAKEMGLELQDEEVDVLLELVSERLMTHGFDAAYRPTEEGQRLERLVDRLSVNDSLGVEPRELP